MENVQLSREEDIILRNIYYDLEHPASYSTAQRLSKASGIVVSRVRQWLSDEQPYSLHRPVRKNFPRRHHVVFNRDDFWQADLVDMTSKADDNSGHKFILMVIDVFSKYGMAQPLKTKSAEAVTAAFKLILERSKRKPRFLSTDQGKEFLNASFRRLLKSQSIEFFHSNDPKTKCSVVERWNRTIKGIMWKHFTHTSSYRWVDHLQKIINGYNHKYHRSIKMAPTDVNLANSGEVYQNLKESVRSRPTRVRRHLTVGSYVRVRELKGPFGKAYEENWSQETLKIKRILNQNPVVYELEDEAGGKVIGTYYAHELQKVPPPDLYKIDKVLRKKRERGKILYFVKFRGYDDTFNEWVEDIVSLV